MVAAQRPSFNVPSLRYFSYGEWCGRAGDICAEIQKAFKAQVAVRSSSKREDGRTQSLAGAFESLLRIDSQNPDELTKAIDFVFSSYGADLTDDDQVLVQEMVTNIAVNGVIFTRSIDDGAPYYVINYDDESGVPDAITGGIGSHKTVRVYRRFADDAFDSNRLRQMIGLARELEAMFGDAPLDIEFILDKSNHSHLLQVRRITTDGIWRADSEIPVYRRFPQVEQFVDALSQRRVGLYGDRTILGNMTDWNPAEIIGVHPSPLSSSLYRYLVTSSAWSIAREQLGYRAVPKTELMVLLAGSPYIDVRASFNSFLPNGLPANICEKLVNGWLDYLQNYPECHDKVEFQVAITIMDFEFDEHFENRYPELLTKEEKNKFRDALVTLTDRMLDRTSAFSLPEARKKIEILSDEQAHADFCPPVHGPVSLVSWIQSTLDQCIRLGTIPFAIIARHAFVAESLLKSAINKGAISAERVAEFKQTVHTVMRDLASDAGALANNEMSEDEFFNTYGHLRPGTYDILSSTYRARPDLLLRGTGATNVQTNNSFDLTGREERAIDDLLSSAGLRSMSAKDLFDYAAEAIEGREYAKFVFTKSLSAALEGIAAWGSHYNINREELALLEIENILHTSYSSFRDSPDAVIMNIIDHNRLERESNRRLHLGYLIRSEKDLHVVPALRSAPNFVTRKHVEAPVVHLTAFADGTEDLGGKIVCIENADPGFDWIFTRSIAGLITKFGGANSHMAIRCSELALPAAIGCGEVIFLEIVSGESAVLNCYDKVVASTGKYYAPT